VMLADFSACRPMLAPTRDKTSQAGAPCRDNRSRCSVTSIN